MSRLKETGLRYFLSENKPILVVTLLGRIDNVTVDGLINCQTEISGYDDIRYIVFYCRDLESISADCCGLLVQIQDEIRARNCALNFSALKPSLREQLIAANVILKNEISDNMQSAISAFSVAPKDQARRMRAAG